VPERKKTSDFFRKRKIKTFTKFKTVFKKSLLKKERIKSKNKTEIKTKIFENSIPVQRGLERTMNKSGF